MRYQKYNTKEGDDIVANDGAFKLKNNLRWFQAFNICVTIWGGRKCFQVHVNQSPVTT